MKDPKYHDRMKHIDTKNNFVRDIVVHKKVVIKYIFMHLMIANLFSKPIPRDVFLSHIASWGLYRV